MTLSMMRSRAVVQKISSRSGTPGAIRLFAILYLVQATIGITAGIAYAVWRYIGA
jgi:hypothetical protein